LEDESDKQVKIDKAKKFFKDFKKDSEFKQYFSSADGQHALLLMKPVFTSQNLKRSRDLYNFINKKLTQNFGNSIPFQLVGRYANKVRDTRQMMSDIRTTGLFAFSVITILLIFGLGTIRGALLVIGTVTVAMGWTMGIAHVFVGQINLLTGFLLAILGGLGVEYGIHLVRRFYQENKLGRTKDEAIFITYFQLGRALFSAAITSAAAFLILSFSDFRAFSELGIIAGGGILSVYVVFMLTFPLFANWLRPEPRFKQFVEIFGSYPFSIKWLWTLIPFVIIVTWGVLHVGFEYDFEKMHDLSKETIVAKRLTNDIMGRSLTPAALLAKNKIEASALSKSFQNKDSDEVIQISVSLSNLVPEDMSWRYKRIKKLEKFLNKTNSIEVEEKTGLSYNQIKAWLSEKPYSLTDLPRQFREAFGSQGRIVLAYPSVSLDRADTIRRFANRLLEAKTDFSGVKVGSEAIVFSEILDHIENDGKWVLLLFLIGAFFVFWLDFRSLKDATFLVLQLLTGMVVLNGLMGFLNIKFTILNVALIPAVLAAGVDMGVHIRHREKEGFKSIASAKYIAQAVQLSALITTIGFGSLFLAEAGMLRGVAWIAVLGQLSMYLICMVFAPILRDCYTDFKLWLNTKNAIQKGLK